MALLQRGSRGDEVAALQEALNGVGYEVSVDGIADAGTDEDQECQLRPAGQQQPENDRHGHDPSERDEVGYVDVQLRTDCLPGVEDGPRLLWAPAARQSSAA